MLGVLRLSDQVVPLLAIVALTARIGDRQAVLDLMANERTNERTKRSASESQGGRTLDESNTHRRLLHLIANVRVAVAVETVLHVALDTLPPVVASAVPFRAPVTDPVVVVATVGHRSISAFSARRRANCRQGQQGQEQGRDQVTEETHSWVAMSARVVV
jgi:hypothetical protein